MCAHPLQPLFKVVPVATTVSKLSNLYVLRNSGADVAILIQPNHISDQHMANAAVLISGGVDSFACAHLIKRAGKKPTGIFVDYGQAALRRERAAVKRVTSSLNMRFTEIRFQLNKSFGIGEIRGRNGLLILAALAAAPENTSVIATGVHAGTPYYDCSPTFINRMDEFVGEYTQGAVRLFAPFLTWSKAEVFAYSRQAALDLSITYSCESGGPACKKCLSCLDRIANDAG